MRSNSPTSSARQQKVMHLLAQDAVRRGTDARAVADAALGLWAQAADELVLLVGQGGVRAIYSRTLHLARSKYPLLPEPAEVPQSAPPFAELRAALERQTAPEALEAGAAFLVTFIDLLAALIGEALTTRLTDSAWREIVSTRGVKESGQ